MDSVKKRTLIDGTERFTKNLPPPDILINDRQPTPEERLQMGLTPLYDPVLEPIDDKKK